MSFASDLKNELTKIRQDRCCDFSELYAMITFSKISKNSNIIFSSKNAAVINKFSKLMFNCFNVKPIISEGGAKDNRYYNAILGSDSSKKSVLSRLNNTETDSLFKRECCSSAFFRGLFLACGSMSDPNKDYHLEFVANDMVTAETISQILKENNFPPKISKRKTSVAVYFKNSSTIEELITKMGASQYTLELIGIKVYKSMRNRYNRINNCETANMTKTVNASVDQIKAIEYLEKCGKMSALPTEIYNVALLRKENPDASLSSLCEMTEEDISRSGMNHRLQKLVKIANSFKNEK